MTLSIHCISTDSLLTLNPPQVHMLEKPVLIILMIESAPADASKGIDLTPLLTARASVPSSYLRL